MVLESDEERETRHQENKKYKNVKGRSSSVSILNVLSGTYTAVWVGVLWGGLRMAGHLQNKLNNEDK